MFKNLRQYWHIVNLKTVFISALAVASTYFCIEYEWVADFPLTIISTAIVFPIVFSIGGAYKRREAALDDYGILKSHGKAIYFASRDWLPEQNEQVQEKCRNHLESLLSSCRKLFTEPVSELRKNEEEVYQSFSNLSKFIRTDLREQGLAGGEVSRCNQYLSKMMTAFESVKHVYQYRTPRTLRAFSDLFIKILPPLYGPYFAYLALDLKPELVYVMPVLFAVILVSLDNIQNHLENPFDQVGEDDVIINVEQFVERLR